MEIKAKKTATGCELTFKMSDEVVIAMLTLLLELFM
ncbi:hypothetical protein JOC93_003227 [Priestia taiwanensis]|nr:hypothetical protein [Priestia taiwanensis]